jgi:hypothetical protein
MLKDITAVHATENYRLWVRFEDGVEGEIDVAQLVSFFGVFTLLQDRAYFVQVRVNAETGTIEWPNEADLDPDVLYAAITGQPLPAMSEANGVTL